MNFASLVKAVDALIAFRDAARRFKPRETSTADVAQAPTAAAPGVAGQIEARLTNVVVAALKEAFDRDHARLELERAHLDEERRRSEAALQLELRRQLLDRELARLRLLAGAVLIGWIASVGIAAAGFVSGSLPARLLLALAWLLLLGALGAAFTAQRQVGTSLPNDNRAAAAGPAAAASLWLLLAGLAASAISLLL